MVESANFVAVALAGSTDRRPQPLAEEYITIPLMVHQPNKNFRCNAHLG
jgi:hypothetical protein